MKRISLHSGVALLAFAVGVACTSSYAHVYSFILGAEEALRPTLTLEGLGPDPSGRLSGGIRVTYLGTEKRDRRLVAAFRLENERPEIIAYWGERKDIPYFIRVKRNGKIVKSGGFICMTGVDIQRLKPGEATTFKVSVPAGTAVLEAGFEFLTAGDVHPPRLVWSERVSLSPTPDI